MELIFEFRFVTACANCGGSVFCIELTPIDIFTAKMPKQEFWTFWWPLREYVKIERTLDQKISSVPNSRQGNVACNDTDAAA